MNPITAQDVQSLEALIDRVGLAEVADALSRIAAEKSEHVQSNWQDAGLARVWMRVSKRFEKLVPALELVDDVLGYRKAGLQ